MIIELASATSTQEEAKARARDGCEHGTVVVAHTQTAGRGRRGRTWLSGPHGLWMSMVLRLDLPMPKAARLSLAASSSVADVLHDVGAVVSVKWPNDLMIASTTTHPALGPFRKAGGLLIEAVDVDDGRLRAAVLGLGLNLSAPPGGFPPELADSAGALNEVGLDLDRWSALALATQLQGGLSKLGEVDDDEAFARVRDRLARRSATLGRRIRVDDVVGVAKGFGDDGALQIEGDDGEVLTVHAGDVMLA